MGKVTVVENPVIKQTSPKGTDIIIKPDYPYSVRHTASGRLVCHVSDKNANPKGVAEGIAALINESSKYKLPIEYNTDLN